MQAIAKTGLPLAAFFFAFTLLPFKQNAQSPYAGGNASAQDIVKKYSLQLSTTEEHVERFRELYTFIDQWLGVPYRWGGCDRQGIDCSCFVKTMFSEVFNIQIQRTSFTQFYDNDVSLFKNANQYSTGDLIFFKTAINRETRRNRITHVGIYLTNDFFVQSSSDGVNIASLKNSYWKACMVAAGRLKESFYKKAGMAVKAVALEDKNKFVVEENSYFDPPVLADRYDSIIKKYSVRLGVAGEEIKVPEMFAYLDSVEQTIYKPTCLPPAGASDCLISEVYKQVFGQDVDAKAVALQDRRLIEAVNANERKGLGDIVYFRTGPKQKRINQSGILLLNGFVAYVDSGRLKMEPLLQEGRAMLTGVRYGRFNPDVLAAVRDYLTQRRRMDDSAARMAALTDPVPGGGGAAKGSAPAAIPIQPTTKKLSELVPPLSVPYQETSSSEYPGIVLRYAKELNVHPLHLTNSLLYKFTDRWREKPFKKGGCSDKKIGYECFITNYFFEVYDRSITINKLTDLNGPHVLPLNSADLLREGDVLFFGKRGETGAEINFTGIYLGGKYFLSLTPQSKKVSLCKVDDPVYEALFLAAGRPR